MPKVECWYKQDLKKPVKPQTYNGSVFTLDNVGSLVGVEVYSDGEPVTLTGTVNGYVILPDETTVSVAGTRSENKAYIALPQSALAYPGFIRITIKLTNSSEITTLLKVVATVEKSRTDTVITPSSQIITDWSQQIAAEMQAVEDASAAQDAKITDLKSALSFDSKNIVGEEFVSDGITYKANTRLDDSGNEVAEPDFRVTSFIPVTQNKTKVIVSTIASDSTNMFRICGYNNSKQPTSAPLLFKQALGSLDEYAITVNTEGVSYIRVSLYFRKYVQYAGPAKSVLDYVNTNKYLIDDSRPITQWLKNNIDFSKNLFVPPETIQGGKAYSSSSQNISDIKTVSNQNIFPYLIEAKPNTKYTASCSTFYVVFFDDYGNYIGYVDTQAGSYTTITVTTPENCRYIGFNSIKGQVGNIMAVEGETFPANYESGYGKIKPEALPVNSIVELSENQTQRMIIQNKMNYYVNGKGFAIDLGVHLTGSASGGYIVIPYSASQTSHIYKVCVAKSEDVLADSSPLSVGYNTTLWAHYDSDSTKDFKLKPVTSLDALSEESDAFYYDGSQIKIKITEAADEYILADDEGGGIGLQITNSVCTISNLTIMYSRGYNCLVSGGFVQFDNCKFMYSSISAGLEISNNAECVCNNCEAFKSRFDGFGNVTGTDTQRPTMVLNNCHGHYCYDDGVSHHNGQFFINGGEYDHNHKAGVASPTYGSDGNITGCYIHDNDSYGFYAQNEDSDPVGKAVINNCLFKGNGWCNVRVKRYNVIAFNCIFVDSAHPNEIFPDSSFVVYPQ